MLISNLLMNLLTSLIYTNSIFLIVFIHTFI